MREANVEFNAIHNNPKSISFFVQISCLGDGSRQSVENVSSSRNSVSNSAIITLKIAAGVQNSFHQDGVFDHIFFGI